MHLTSIGSVIDAPLLVLAASATAAVALVIAGACLMTWLAVRNTRPQDRPAVLKAVADVLNGLGSILNRHRR
ncbi:hypothetical protein [Saccharothrix sp. NRRL B-16314]|uniref:hypothetical protein n=1 Tax=Saccharothrix sp. NRRL B-16314 TaxID=1463825 RepID=UPI0012DBEA3E|nr:hypothetical protein [Saccharothrix sp. NRRL B-16314]